MFELFGAVAGALGLAAPVFRNLGEIAQGGRQVLDFAGNILGLFRKKVPPEQQQAVLAQAFAQAAAMPQAQFDKKAAEIVELELVDQPVEQKKAATEYLQLMQARIKTAFARPADPTGTTVPPNFAIRRAGLQTWPRLFHNLRASCETDLMKDHPIHVVAAWIGNTPKIALAHYRQTLEGDFEKAVKGGAESGAVTSRPE